MKKYYVCTHSKDRLGNKRRSYKVITANSKAEIRKKAYFWGVIDSIQTYEQVLETWGREVASKFWGVEF